ncbi:MAG: hypothetical protein JJU36_15535 [Phycisphaeraceae bacterium]|nr:hypothetical protein [Phycisphaeraceae bacterium]
MRLCFLWVVVLLPLAASVPALADSARDADAFWFDRLESVEPLMRVGDERSRDTVLVDWVATRLLADTGSRPELPRWAQEDREPRIAFVSAAHGGDEVAVAMGRGRGVVAALEQALVELRAIPGFLDPPPRWVRVDLVHQVTEPRRVPMQAMLTIDRSFVGIAFEQESGLAFLPDELMARHLVAPGGAIELSRMTRYLGRRRPVPSQPVSISTLDERRLIFFSTHGFFADQHGSYPLFRGHRVWDRPDRETVLNQARMAGQYLRGMVDSGGRVPNLYLADEAERAPGAIVERQAAALLGVVMHQRLTRGAGDPQVARRMVEPIRARIRRMQHRDQILGAVEEDGWVHLGANARALSALAGFLQVTDRPEREILEDAQKLAGWMLAILGPDGRFLMMRQSATTRQVDREFVGVSEPSAAALAWLALYRVDGQERWRQAAERVLRYLVEVRDSRDGRPLPLDTIPRDEVQMRALLASHAIEPNNDFLRRAAYLGNAIMMERLRHSDVPDLAGALAQPPRGEPNARRALALIELEEALARGLPADRQERLATLRGAIHEAVAFSLGMQIGPELAMLLPEPERALGGVRDALDQFAMRMDHTAIHIELLLAYAAFLERQPD